jgi:hypothetical protein
MSALGHPAGGSCRSEEHNLSETVRVTLDVDRDWITQIVTIDKKGRLVFEPATALIVSIEEV